MRTRPVPPRKAKEGSAKKMKAGEWLQWRKDSQRSGIVELPGRVGNPQITGMHFLGGREDWLVLHANETNSDTCPLAMAVSGPIAEESVRRDWGLDRWVDVEGTGVAEKIVETARERYWRSDDGQLGYVRMYFESAFDKGMRDDDMHGWLERRIDGEWRRIWTTASDYCYYRPNVLLTDIDGDGEDEIVLAVHYRLMAFNKRTGMKVRELKYHNYRNYGEIHAVDLTGNGLCDFVQIVNFPAHLEVILNDGQQFRLAWFQDVQHGDITDSEHILSTPRYPLADVDGDGRPEIVYSRYNEHDDHKWHTLVLEPLSGQVKYDISDFLVQDMLPLGQNGAIQLFGVQCDRNFVPAAGGAAIYEIIAGIVSLVSACPDYAWCFWSPYEWENYKSSQWLYGQKRAIARIDGGRSVLMRTLVDADTQTYRLEACRFAGGEREVTRQSVLPEFTLLSVRETDNELLLTTCRSAAFEVRSKGFAARLIGTRPFAGPVAAPVVLQADGKQPLLVVPDLLGSIRALELDRGGAFSERWKLTGHGMSGDKGVCVRRTEVSGRSVVFAAAGPRGEARIVQADDCGAIEWMADIPRTHASLQPGEGGGFLSLHTLPLRAAGRDDVLVTCLKNNMHSGFTTALAGDGGEILWRQEKSGGVYIGPNNENELRGFGGSRLFAGYPKPDGTEDLLSQFPDLLYIAEGSTGQFAVHERTQHGSFYQYDKEADVVRNAPVLHGIPVIIRLEDHYGKYAALWGGCTFAAGLWLRTPQGGYFAWTTPYCHSLSPVPLQAVGSFSQNGRYSVIGWDNARNTVTCRDLEGGGLRWQLDLPGANSAQYYVTCDIDDDGREECLLCTTEHLIAIAEKDGAGAELWRLPLPAPCTQPVVADADGDGKAEILLPCSDGYLYVVSERNTATASGSA